MSKNAQNVRKFNIEIDKLGSAIGKAVTKFTKEVAQDVFNEIVERSPVSSGSFRASNRLGIGTADESFVNYPRLTGTIEEIRAAETRRKTTATNVAKLQLGKLVNLGVYEKVIVSNNSPHANAVEFGVSRQAPFGVYGITYHNMMMKYSRPRD